MDSMHFHRRSLLQLAAGLAAGGAAPLLRAQAWPSKPIRLVVPFAPGGSSEIIARATAVEMSKLLGQSVFVDNKPGGAGNIAMTEVARAEDQHTLILGHIGTLAVNPFIFDKLPFDVNKDFKPVSLLAKVPSLYLVNPEVPAKNLVEFIALAKKKPGQLNYGSAGNGSAGHLAMEYLKMSSGIFITHVPYRGTGPMLTDLIAGRLDAASIGAAAVLQFVRTGKLRCIATGTAQRIAAAARCAHGGRTRLPRLRDDAVVRPERAGIDAASRHRQAGRGRSQGGEGAGHTRAAGTRRGHRHRQHAGRLRQVHRGRTAALATGDRAGEDQARLN